MYTFLSILYVLVCLFLILVVLLQPGRGGVGGAFGGGGSQTVFGGSGAGNFLTRLTSISAALFMMLSGTLAYMSSSSDKSLERASEAARAKAASKVVVDAGVKSAPDLGAGPTESTPTELAPEPAAGPEGAAAPAEKQEAPTLERIVPPAPADAPAKPATK
ncbi:MAG: Preprotein translocase subunit SecG [Myxococcaceae bacterium]|nr:Preprotein translocase subunit SecG [Myxococcaceae bacterium]